MLESLESLFESMLKSPHFAFFIIVAIGLLVGRISVKGISLDVSAVIFVALAFGHYYGPLIPKAFGTLGLVLFIFTIGMQAGPEFIQSFKSKGKVLILTAAIIIVSAVLTGLGLSYAYGVTASELVGILAGALTSTPGLAVAKDAAQDPGIAAITYGIAYPFGVIGVVLFVKLFPVICRINLKKEEEKVDAKLQALSPDQKTVARPDVKVMDFLPVAIGIGLGTLLGKLPLAPGVVLGLPGGVLFAALLLGGMGKTGPVTWTLPKAGNGLLRQLGLILFLSEVGTTAGAKMLDAIQNGGITFFFVGFAVTLVPMLIAGIVGYYVFNISIFDTLGTITGGMTSTPGLAAADTPGMKYSPSVAYATVYPVAMILLMIFIRLITIFYPIQ